MRRRRKACILIGTSKHPTKGSAHRTRVTESTDVTSELIGPTASARSPLLLPFLSHRRSWETLSHGCWFDTSFISPLIRCIDPCLSPPLTRDWILLPAFIIGIFLIGLYYNLFTAFASFKFPFGSLAFLSISCIGTPVYDEGSSVLKTAIPKKRKGSNDESPRVIFLAFFFVFIQSSLY